MVAIEYNYKLGRKFILIFDANYIGRLLHSQSHM